MKMKPFLLSIFMATTITASQTLAKDGDRLSIEKSQDLLGTQGPMPGEYVLVNAKTRMCLGKTIDADTNREVLLTLNCSEAAVKSKNYKEFLAIIPNTKQFFNIRNAKTPDALVEKGKYGKCATFDTKNFDGAALQWADCGGVKSDAAFKSNASKGQTFDFVYLSNKTWQIQYIAEDGNDYCLDLLHVDPYNSEVAMVRCTYDSSQHWAIVYAGDLKEGPTKSSVMADGYVKDANGVLVRARIINGVKFTPNTKTQTSTKDEKMCRDLCVKDKACFSFSFFPKTPTGKNVCENHTALSLAVSHNGASSARIFRPITPCDMNDWNKCLK